MKDIRCVPLMFALYVGLVFGLALSCGRGADHDTGNDSGLAPDDDSLHLASVVPSSGGASVSTSVTLHGDGFRDGLRVTVGGINAESIQVESSMSAFAVFPSVLLKDRGKKDVHVILGTQEASLHDGFEYYFDEDPIVFVHGLLVSSWEWDVMIERFREIGYPDDYLAAIKFSSSVQSNVINACDELPPFVDEVLARTGARKVDIICHSAAGLSTRLWIKFYGGEDKVRDYVSLSGTHHGTITTCIVPRMGEGAAEQCPAYAGEEESVNAVQWLLNGNPDTDDVDETPYGVEDGGGIYYNAFWTDGDIIDVPPQTCCLNQKFRNDCSDPVNVAFHGIGHMGMTYNESVFLAVLDRIRMHNASKP